MIRNVFLDLDDTIFDFGRAEREALTRTLVHFGVTPASEILDRYSELNLMHWRMLERGEITREQVKVRRYERLFDEYGIDISAADAAEYYEHRLSIGHFFLDGAPELLNNLKNGGYRLFIVSNGSASVQKGRLDSAGIESMFDGIFISQNIGFDKPDRRFFERCFSKISDFDRSQSVIMGDSLTSDIKGGKNAGIATVWFNPHGAHNATDITPDYTVERLCDLPELLMRI